MSSTQRHYKWLKAELPRLEEEGVLDSASRERLAAHCTTRLNECTGNGFGGFFLTAMCVIGMLFITAGIVMLIAYNWHEFGKTMQIAIGMAPLVIAGILSVFTLVRLPTEGVKTMCFREASALLTACGIATSIAVISQIYQISGDIRDYMLVVLLLSLPHIYLFKSRALFIIFICE
ncbi:MAG: DUF2157 domain-containing protein [Lentisphaeria bacterium]|nr:DUF2157 domain-containing protein [Lentisphaeria bacterium]